MVQKLYALGFMSFSARIISQEKSKFDQIFSKLISTASVACYYEKITRVHVNFGSGSTTYFDSKSYI